jgi:hypothetical protein
LKNIEFCLFSAAEQNYLESIQREKFVGVKKFVSFHTNMKTILLLVIIYLLNWSSGKSFPSKSYCLSLIEAIEKENGQY